MAKKPKPTPSVGKSHVQSAQSSSRRSQVDLTSAHEGPIWRQYLRAMGPGLVTGASDDDPSGIATYSQAGAQFGLAFLWSALLTFPLMAAVQEICDRTALATGRGLGELAVERFHRTGRAVLGLLLIVLIVANALNIAADLVAIGSGMELLQTRSTWLWALLAGATITSLLVIGSFARIALVFKVLCAPLLAYVVVAILVTHQWGKVLANTFVPHIQLNKTYLALLVAVLGTTISPYLFFWQSAHRIEEMRDAPEGGDEPQPLKRMSRRRARSKERTSRLDVFTEIGRASCRA